METTIDVMHAVQYSVKSASSPDGRGIALEFIVIQPDGTQGRLPHVFLPLDKAENLADAIRDMAHPLRAPH